jgi:integrase
LYNASQAKSSVVAHLTLGDFVGYIKNGTAPTKLTIAMGRRRPAQHAKNTVRNIRTVSSAIFAAAVKYGYLKSNPVRSVELPPEPVELLQVLPSDKQLARLLDELPEPYRTMVWLVCISGVRIGELLALRWRAVDWDRSCF